MNDSDQIGARIPPADNDVFSQTFVSMMDPAFKLPCCAVVPPGCAIAQKAKTQREEDAT